MLALLVPESSYLNYILDNVENCKVDSISHTIIYKANMMNHDFIIMVTGYGKVNIARSLQYLIDNYQVKVLLTLGTAGSINDSNSILNAVIVNNTLQYDVDFTPLGYAPSVIPDMKKGIYSSNEDLVTCMQEACYNANVCYINDLVASGDMFVCNNGLSNSIRREYSAGAVDCECGSIGEFAYVNKIPFIGLKVISNYANNNAVRQYNLYNEEASLISQKIVYQFLKGYYN